jgi:hypothetical protein
MVTISLPAESISPFSLGILIITVIIFFIIVYSARYIVRSSESKKQREEEVNKKKEEQRNQKLLEKAKIDVLGIARFMRDDTLQAQAQQAESQAQAQQGSKKGDLVGTITTVGGFIVSVLGVGVIPLIVFPLIDYSAYTENSSVIIVVKNIGLTSAKDVVVSLNIDHGAFSDLITDPYIADEFKKNITAGHAYGKLDVLPPRETVKFTAPLSPGTYDKAVISPHVFSDERMGKVNSLWTVCFYALLAATYSLMFMKLYFKDTITMFSRADFIGTILVIVVYVSIFMVLYHVVAVIPTYPNSNPAYPV